MQKRISIIILVYNNFRFYKDCLISIFQQTYENIEIIISDDGSENFNKKELLEFIKDNKGKNIKKVIINENEKNMGIVKNYNKALSLIEGDYIFYLCIDDVFYDNKVIEDCVNYFEANNYDIFTGYKDVYDESLKKYIKTLPRKNEVNFLKENNATKLYERLCVSSFISGSNTPFSKKLLNEYGYLNEDYYYLEDYPRYLELSKKGCKIGFFDRKIIKYRMGGITTNGIINEKLRADLKIVTESLCSEFFKGNWNGSWLKKKKLIAWGSGDCFINCLNKFERKFDYVIDSNINFQGKKIQGINITFPETLLKENKEEIFIFIFTYANYFDIIPWLEKHGFKEKENFFICTPNILEVINS